jgi:cytochrome c-type biogenesis protein CcsB
VGISVTDLEIGPEIVQMSDSDIVGVHNERLRNDVKQATQYKHVVFEVPLGSAQIEYFARCDQWVPRSCVLRCLIGGRPPVTNMYESIIWVSFAASFFGMIFFARYRTPIYLLASLPATLVALLLVHQMPIAMPASIDPLVPVLRDNFWLTIHVLTITLSYAAFLLACAFGHILLFRYARNPRAARADAAMHFWLYRVLQLGVLLLAAGTILGGVWANYSWGRFWGWDPKETWALIALLCYITTLHGRLAGWWTEFGLVVASVVCFLAVLMAWYGVNFVLGKGLHSYGFGIGGETYVGTFVVADLLFVAFAIWRYRSSKRAVNRRGAAVVAAVPAAE